MRRNGIDFIWSSIADSVGTVFGGFIGIPLMLIIVMPYCARLLEMGELRFRYYMVPALVIGPVLAFVTFPIFFGLRDGLSFAAPTLLACFIAMLLVYIGYVVGAPHVTPEMLSSQYGLSDKKPGIPDHPSNFDKTPVMIKVRVMHTIPAPVAYSSPSNNRMSRSAPPSRTFKAS